MKSKPKTDREISLASDEFIWDANGLLENHQYVSRPIINKLNRHKVKKVLDLGCGNGALTSVLAENGYEVLGLDYSSSGIELAQQQFPTINFKQHDISLPLSSEYMGKYDAVTSVEVIEHLLLPRKLIENAWFALKPGGLFILTTPYHGYWKNLALALTNKFDDHWHPLRDFGHIKFFSKKTITQLFMESEFENLKIDLAGRVSFFACSMVITVIKPN